MIQRRAFSGRPARFGGLIKGVPIGDLLNRPGRFVGAGQHRLRYKAIKGDIDWEWRRRLLTCARAARPDPPARSASMVFERCWAGHRPRLSRDLTNASVEVGPRTSAWARRYRQQRRAPARDQPFANAKSFPPDGRPDRALLEIRQQQRRGSP